MQNLQGLVAADFKDKAKEPISKIEIFIDPNWIDLCNLDGKNYLIEAHYSGGQRELSYEPLAGDVEVIIDDTDGDFHPKNPSGLYKDYLKVGRKIRFSTGFKNDGSDYLWQWFIGIISSIDIDRPNRKVTIKGFDYTQRLIEKKLESPNNYWGTSVTKSTVNGQAEYDMPGACNGVYIAILDGDQIYDQKHWVYDRTNNKFIFLNEYVPGNGVDNLIIYYYIDQVPEEVIADILVKVGLYANQGAALADMDYDDTGIIIERVYFEKGESAFNAVQKMCERVDYVFYFKYDGTPVFKSIPEKEDAGVFDFEANLIGKFDYIENIDEVRNHIIVEGEDYSILDEIVRILNGTEIMPGAINKDHISVDDLSAINANIGTINVGKIGAGGFYVTTAELMAGVYRALAFIQASPWLGGYMGMLMNDETGFYWAGNCYKLTLFPQGGDIYYLGIEVNSGGMGGGGGTGEEPPEGDPEIPE